MEREHPDDYVVSSLKQVLDFIDGHVKFAETKNAAILAVNAAFIIGIVQSTRVQDLADSWTSRWLIYSITLSILSSVAALLSFLPLTDRLYHWKQRVSENDNLLFFGDVQKYSERSYFEAFLRAKAVPERQPTGLELMYSHQIVTNAKLAAAKFGDFRFAAWIVLNAVLTPIGAAILVFVIEGKQHFKKGTLAPN